MIRVLVDAIHADLLHSLRMLFEDRYGWELYTPGGMDWYEEGIWRFERERLGDVVARQFLQPWDADVDRGTYSERQDQTHPGRIIRRLTLAQARDLRPDIVIATLAENEFSLAQLARETGATYGIQIGNQGAMNNFALAAFVMSSVTLPRDPWMPHVYYHQEFSLDDFRYEYPPVERDLVATRVQCITDTPEHVRFRQLAALVPEARFRHYGHCGEQDDLWGGNAHTSAEVAEQMRAARIGWHAKRWSDGYGHVVHNWFAVGRPVLGTAGYYADKLAGPLFVEGETSFDIDGYTDHDLAELIRWLLTDDDAHRRLSENARRRFEDVVSFDDEARAIREMLDRVMSDRRVAA